MILAPRQDKFRQYRIPKIKHPKKPEKKPLALLYKGDFRIVSGGLKKVDLNLLIISL